MFDGLPSDTVASGRNVRTLINVNYKDYMKGIETKS